jgi:hypothetical protein
MLEKSIKEFLETIPQDFTKIEWSHWSEHDISSKIVELIKQNWESHTQSVEDIAEQVAFDFIPNYSHEENNWWNSYYWPYWILPNEKWIMMEYPSKSKVTPEIINYWKARAEESNIEICKYRYADLVIDFGEKEDYYEMAQILINSWLLIIENLYVTPLNLITKAKRIVNIAISIDDKSLMERIIKALIHLEEIIWEDEFPWLWWFCMSELVLNQTIIKKWYLGNKEKDVIVDRLKLRLDNLVEGNWLEHVVWLLSEYYSRINDAELLVFVLKKFEEWIKKRLKEESNAILISSQYEHIHEVFWKYKHIQWVKEEYNRISREISWLELDWENSLQKISTSFQIEQEKIDDLVNWIFRDWSTLEDTLIRIFVNWFPRKVQTEKELEEYISQYPLQFLCNTGIIWEDWVTIARIWWILWTGEWKEKHLLRQYWQSMSVSWIFLEIFFDNFCQRYTLDEIDSFIKKSSIFETEDEIYILRAFMSYYDKDHLVASMLFISIIERWFRNLIRLMWLNILTLNDYWWYDYLPLSKLLTVNGCVLDEIFTSKDWEISYYYKFVLIEKLGMNLRNDCAHGIGRKKFLQKETANRLFHLIIGLALIKMRPNNKSS